MIKTDDPTTCTPRSSTPFREFSMLEPSPFDVLGEAHPLTGPMDEFVREDLFDDCCHAVAVSVANGKTLVRTPRGACIIRIDYIHGAPIAVFDHVESDGLVRRTFWFNKHSLGNLGDKLRAIPRRKWSDIVLEVIV